MQKGDLLYRIKEKLNSCLKITIPIATTANFSSKIENRPRSRISSTVSLFSFVISAAVSLAVLHFPARWIGLFDKVGNIWAGIIIASIVLLFSGVIAILFFEKTKSSLLCEEENTVLLLVGYDKNAGGDPEAPYYLHWTGKSKVRYPLYVEIHPIGNAKIIALTKKEGENSYDVYQDLSQKIDIQKHNFVLWDIDGMSQKVVGRFSESEAPLTDKHKYYSVKGRFSTPSTTTADFYRLYRNKEVDGHGVDSVLDFLCKKNSKDVRDVFVESIKEAMNIKSDSVREKICMVTSELINLSENINSLCLTDVNYLDKTENVSSDTTVYTADELNRRKAATQLFLDELTTKKNRLDAIENEINDSDYIKRTWRERLYLRFKNIEVIEAVVDAMGIDLMDVTIDWHSKREIQKKVDELTTKAGQFMTDIKKELDIAATKKAEIKQREKEEEERIKEAEAQHKRDMQKEALKVIASDTISVRNFATKVDGGFAWGTDKVEQKPLLSDDKEDTKTIEQKKPY